MPTTKRIRRYQCALQAGVPLPIPGYDRDAPAAREVIKVTAVMHRKKVLHRISVIEPSEGYQHGRIQQTSIYNWLTVHSY